MHCRLQGKAYSHPTMFVGKLLSGGAQSAPPHPAPSPVTATPSHTSPELHQEYFKGTTIPFYLHPREDSQSELKDNIPLR